MSKEAIEKAKKFIDTIDKFNKEEFSFWKIVGFDYSKSNKPYFVFLENNKNEYSCSARFCTRKELERLIYMQQEQPTALKIIWDRISILDVKKNKVVKAKICTQIKLQ